MAVWKDASVNKTDAQGILNGRSSRIHSHFISRRHNNLAKYRSSLQIAIILLAWLKDYAFTNRIWYSVIGSQQINLFKELK